MKPTGTLGDEVRSFLQGARNELIVCAPFIKRHALRSVLPEPSDDLSLNVFTRWRPEEVAAGVSDPRVFLDIEARGGELWLCDRLHAKLYAADDRALLGSANVTGAALGWAAASNLEVLSPVKREAAEVTRLETALSEERVPASKALMEEVIAAAELFEMPPAMQESEIASQRWLPHLRYPEDLFTAYSKGAVTLASGSAAAATFDLAVLEVLSGLDREGFEEIVRTRLRQRSEMKALSQFIDRPRRFGEVRAWMQDEFGLERAEDEAGWQALMRWCLYFLPDTYARAVPGHSEIIVKRGDA